MFILARYRLAARCASRGHMRTPVYGTLLASGRRTVIAALRAMGRGDERHFTTFQRFLNRAVWSPFPLSPMLLGLLVTAFLAPDAPLILLIDGSAIGHFYCPSTGKIRYRPEQK